MPRNNHITFDGPDVLVARRVRTRAEGEIPVNLDITVAGPEDLVAAYLEESPITITAFPAEAYEELSHRLTTEQTGQQTEGKEPPHFDELRPLRITIRVVEAPRDPYALLLEIDSKIPTGCSHHYYFAAKSIDARIIWTSYGDPDLNVASWSKKWTCYGNFESSFSKGLTKSVYWRLRVYGAGGKKCNYQLNNALLKQDSDHNEVADNPVSNPIGF